MACQTKDRSGWPIKRTLRQLGVSPASYYRWRNEAQRTKSLPAEPVKPVQAYEATDEEKQAVRSYALKHPGIRHRELAWRMVDEDVVYLSQSTVYRILKDQNLVSPWRRRKKRPREEAEKATRPDERWATDLMYVEVTGRKYYQLNFIDEYSRHIPATSEHGGRDREPGGAAGDRTVPPGARRRDACRGDAGDSQRQRELLHLA